MLVIIHIRKEQGGTPCAFSERMRNRLPQIFFKTLLIFSVCLTFSQARAVSGSNGSCSALFSNESRDLNFQKLYGVEYLNALKINMNDKYLAGRFQTDPGVFKSQRARYSAKSDLELTADAKSKLEADDFSPSSLSVFEASVLYAKDVKGGHIADIQIKQINDVIGLGVFARSRIDKGKMIGEYTGVLKETNATDAANAYLFNSRYHGYVIDAQNAGNETRFINHSRDHANAVIQNVFEGGRWQIVIVAARDIQAGEQILFDYGRGYWRNRTEPQELINQ